MSGTSTLAYADKESHAIAARAADIGHHCPSSGWWQGTRSGRVRYISEGSVMPPGGGSSESWYALNATAPHPRTTPILSKAPSDADCEDGCIFCTGPETD